MDETEKPQEQNQTRGPGRPKKQESNPQYKNPLLAFLEKDVLETMEEFYSFRDYQRRYKVGERKACVVSPEIYDVVTEGDVKFPLFWSNDVPIIDSSRKQEGLTLLGCNNKIQPVIIR